MTADARPEAGGEVERVLADLAAAFSCGQCGRPFNHRACGPTHAIIAADPRRHRLIAPLLAEHVGTLARVRAAEQSLRAAALSLWAGERGDEVMADALTRWSERLTMALENRLAGDEDWLTPAAADQIRAALDAGGDR